MKLLWEIFKDNLTDEWIGVCDGIGLTACGKTIPLLLVQITDSTETLFYDLVSEGNLEDFLVLRGLS